MDVNDKLDFDQQWMDLRLDQGWGDRKQVAVLEGFIVEHGFQESFMAYARQVAREDEATEAADNAATQPDVR